MIPLFIADCQQFSFARNYVQILMVRRIPFYKSAQTFADGKSEAETIVCYETGAVAR